MRTLEQTLILLSNECLNEQSKYDKVQSTVLVDGRPYWAVARHLNVAPLSTSKSANNDVGITYVSWLLISPHTDPLLIIYYAALLPRRGPHIASHSVCPSVCPSVRPVIVTERHVAPPSELQWYTCTFRHALRASVLFGTHWGPHIVRPSGRTNSCFNR